MARILKPGGRLVIVDRAYLVGPGLQPRLIKWLYNITGQGPTADDSELGYLRLLGWHVTEREQQLAMGVVHLLVADNTRSFPQGIALP